MTGNESAKMYQKYHVDKQDERLGLFQLLVERFNIERGLYPGCFVHITPSFIIPDMTYVEIDKRARKFFTDPTLPEFIAKHKIYQHEVNVTFHPTDYNERFDEPLESYDLLISQYAGFISEPCKLYLKIGGILLANNSHGDASMASIDDDYEFVAVVMRQGERFRLVEQNLDAYFVPKSNVDITKDYLRKIGRGVGYKKSGSAYIFKRVK
jgi:hypothetical protein